MQYSFIIQNSFNTNVLLLFMNTLAWLHKTLFRLFFDMHFTKKIQAHLIIKTLRQQCKQS